MQTALASLTTISRKLLAGLYPVKSRKTLLLLSIITSFFLLFNSSQVNAQNTGDFRSNGGGNWEDAATWEIFNGLVAGWVTSTYAPSSADGVITIINGDQVNINSSVSIDQVVIENGATLIAFAGTVTVNNGTGTDVYNNGTFSFNTGVPNLSVSFGANIDGPASPSSYVNFDGATLTNNGTIYSLTMVNGSIAGAGSIGTLLIFHTAPGDINILSGTQTITGLLNFNYGNISTGPNKIIVAASASVQNNSATDWYVKGSLQMNFPNGNNTKTFRIGDASGYRPVSLALFNVSQANVSGMGGVRASTSSGEFPQIATSTIDSNKSVNRWWLFTNDSLAFTNSIATLSWDPSEVDPGANSANFGAGRWIGSWSYPAVSNAHCNLN